MMKGSLRAGSLFWGRKGKIKRGKRGGGGENEPARKPLYSKIKRREKQ